MNVTAKTLTRPVTIPVVAADAPRPDVAAGACEESTLTHCAARSAAIAPVVSGRGG